MDTAPSEARRNKNGRKPFGIEAGTMISHLLILHMSEASKNGRLWEDNMCSVPRTGTLSILLHLMLPFLEDLDGLLGEWALAV